jgi:hypothetical protein
MGGRLMEPPPGDQKEADPSICSPNLLRGLVKSLDQHSGGAIEL